MLYRKLFSKNQRGGMRKGGSAPLAGGAGCTASASAFLLARGVLSAWGEPARPGFPREGKRERGDQNLVAAAGLFNFQGVTDYRCS
jgi:hypothetical protein